MHHEDPPRLLPAPCHTMQDPDGNTYFVPGCAGRANDPDNEDCCTCVDFKDAALALVAQQDAELREASRRWLRLGDDYAKLAAKAAALESKVAVLEARLLAAGLPTDSAPPAGRRATSRTPR